MTTATMPRRIMRPVATSPARRSMLLGFGLTLAAGLALLVGTSLAIGVSAGTGVMNGVTVGGVSLAGLDRAAAAERLRAELPSVSAGQAVLTIQDASEVVSYESLGRAYELDAMVDAALGVGRAGHPVTDAVGRLRTLAHPTSLPVIVHAYDPEALATIAGDIATRVSRPPVEAAVLRAGTAFAVRASDPGSVLEASVVADALAGAASNTSPDDVALSLAPVVVDPVVDTATAEAAAEAARGMVADLELTISGGDAEESLLLDAETIAGWISFGPQADQHYAARIDTTALGAHVAALAAEVDQDPVNARITVASGGGLGGVTPGQDGRALDVDASVAAIVGGLTERAGGSRLATMGLAVNVTEPTFSTAAAEAALPQMQLVSSWTTYYVPGDGNGYGNNINIPARDIDGRNLAPGEWFSFWGSIGPVTVERGYHYGGVIIGGRSVAGGAIGGGICSTSTTIFNAALRAGLEMGDRLNHYYYIDRYPDGLDATVYMADGWAQDMTFRNDTEHPIVIRGFGGNGFVTFQIWSIPTGRTVVLTDPATSNHRAAIETTQVSTSLAPGTSKRVEYPHDGHDVSRTRIVYDANGSEIHRNTWFSSYRTVNGITLVGPSAPAAEAPPPADVVVTAEVPAGDAPPTEPAAP